MTNCCNDYQKEQNSLWKKLTENEPPDKKVFVRRSIDGEPFTYDFLKFTRMVNIKPHKYHPDFYSVNDGFCQSEDVNYPEYIEWVDPQEIQ